MCGRFTLAKNAVDLIEELPEFDIDERVEPRYNIAPSQPLLTLLNDGSMRSTFTQWGLVPAWARDPNIGHKMINARSETAAEKPSFRVPFKRKRCLIPADGWYEWKKIPGQRVKQPMYFHRRDRSTFAFAGLWDEWHSKDGSLLITSTILTTEANELSRPIHHRMPVIIGPEDYPLWLDPFEDDRKRLQPLLVPAPDVDFLVHPVSTRVNTPKCDDEDCIRKLDNPPGQADFFTD